MSRNRKYMLYFLFNSLIVISLNVMAQEWVKPVRNSVLLSGNFGELRATHFHSGIDIRTGGVEGWPVICVRDGQLVRVSVSPTGYGQALYIEHPDGTTTVYGHLQRFVPAVTKLVRALQYQQESFRVDEDFRLYHIFFKQGDTIAYTGNTGSSGGPHLHFEVRNTLTEHTLNPLHYYQIRDTKAPVARKLYLYTLSEKGCVDLWQSCGLKAEAPGQYAGGRIQVPAGKIGVGVYATDYMNDSWNKLGVYQLTLVAGQDTLFTFRMDSCSFDQGGYINEVKDFECYKKKETVYRCFGNYQEYFRGIVNRGKGYIRVAEDSLVKVQISLSDINGNRSVVNFSLKGGKPLGQEKEEVLNFDEGHVLELSGCRVELEAGALFSSVRKQMRVEKDTLTGNDIFVLSAKDIPLFKKALLRIQGQFGPQAVICEVDGNGRKFPVKTHWAPDALEARIGYLNRYTVVEDQIAPQISFLGKFPDRTLRFKIRDNLSGIAAYRGEVNGKWGLFSYDPRTDVLQCSLTEPVFVKGQVNEVRISVTDQAGNKKDLQIKIIP